MCDYRHAPPNLPTSHSTKKWKTRMKIVKSCLKSVFLDSFLSATVELFPLEFLSNLVHLQCLCPARLCVSRCFLWGFSTPIVIEWVLTALNLAEKKCQPTLRKSCRGCCFEVSQTDSWGGVCGGLFWVTEQVRNEDIGGSHEDAAFSRTSWLLFFSFSSCLWGLEEGVSFAPAVKKCSLVVWVCFSLSMLV